MYRIYLTCGYLESSDEVVPIAFIFKPWELLLRYAYIAMLYDHRRGLVWVIHDRCESFN